MNFSIAKAYPPNDPQGSPKKRLLFVITQSEFGGAQRFLYNLVSRLNKDRYEIAVAIGNTGNGEFLDALKEVAIPYRLLKHLKRRVSLVSDIRAAFEIRKLVKEFRADVLFLNSSKAGFVASLGARFPSRLPVKIIYRIGGWSFNDPGSIFNTWLWIILEWLSAKWKDIIIVNSRYDLDRARELKIKPREKMILIHNGIDVYKLNFMSQDEARVKLFEKTSRSSGKIFQIKTLIGTIANFYPTKGLEYLIEAAGSYKDTPDVAFFIIGDGQERKNLEELIHTKGLDKKVFLVGQLKNAFKYLGAFDVFVLPSVKEGFPWSLIEAMSCKLPVIATRVGAIPEIIENGKNGFVVESRNPVQIVEKLNEILANDHLKKEFGIQAHQTILFKFELEKMISKIEALL